MKVYLAGPEVFFMNAAEVAKRKCEIVLDYGMTPLFPGDAQIRPEPTLLMTGCAISEADEMMMRDADAVIANMTPWRGVSADVGTCFEMGFMSALGKLVVIYSNDPEPYAQRVIREFGGKAGADGNIRTNDGTLVENFGMADNLMIHGGAMRRGAEILLPDRKLEIDDLSVFESAVIALKNLSLSETPEI